MKAVKIAEHYKVYKATLRDIIAQAEKDKALLDKLEERNDDYGEIYENLEYIELKADDLIADINYFNRLARGLES